jgi:hypothetical protein
LVKNFNVTDTQAPESPQDPEKPDDPSSPETPDDPGSSEVPSKTPISVPNPGTIASVVVNPNGTVTVTYSNGAAQTYDTATQQVNVSYPTSMFKPSATSGTSVVLTGSGTLIPDGTSVRVIVTATTASSYRTMAVGEGYELTSTVSVSGGNTIVHVDLSSVEDGLYSLSLESRTSANPYFKAPLVDTFRVLDSGSGNTEKSKGGGGGCDAGLAGAGLLLAVPLLARKTGKR